MHSAQQNRGAELWGHATTQATVAQDCLLFLQIWGCSRVADMGTLLNIRACLTAKAALEPVIELSPLFLISAYPLLTRTTGCSHDRQPLPHHHG